jgi:hypothetical protein
VTAALRRVGPAALLLLAVLAAAGASPAAPATSLSRAAGAVRHVVIMSFDGLGGEAAREAFPAAMVARAAFTWTAQTTLPSSTLPAHTSMLTGVPPAVHGVRTNPTRPVGHLRLPTVFSIVAQHGGTAAAFVTKPKLLYLMAPGTVGRAELMPYPQYPMVAVVREAARHLARAQPQLLFIHLSDPDDAGHRYGWGSAPYRQTAAGVPEAVEVILDVLARMGRLEDSLVIVTADHGGRGRRHGGNTPAETTIPWLAFGAVSAGPIIAPVMTYDTAATAIAALGWPVPSSWAGRPVVQPVEKVR